MLIFTKRICWIASLGSVPLNFKKINWKLHMKFCKHKQQWCFHFFLSAVISFRGQSTYKLTHMKTHNCLCVGAYVKSRWSNDWMNNHWFPVCRRAGRICVLVKVWLSQGLHTSITPESLSAQNSLVCLAQGNNRFDSCSSMLYSPKDVLLCQVIIARIISRTGESSNET